MSFHGSGIEHINIFESSLENSDKCFKGRLYRIRKLIVHQNTQQPFVRLHFRKSPIELTMKLVRDSSRPLPEKVSAR